MKITTVGIDLAKNVFQVHGIDERGNAVLRKQLRRAQWRISLRICRRV
jgi:transposase